MTVAPGTKLESGPATLHLCNDILVVARDVPPVVTGQWKLSDLRRYGAVPNGFIFEGGTRCGYCKYAAAGTPAQAPALLASRDAAWGLSLTTGAGCESRPPDFPSGVGGAQQGEGDGRDPAGSCAEGPGVSERGFQSQSRPGVGGTGWASEPLEFRFHEQKKKNKRICEDLR